MEIGEDEWRLVLSKLSVADLARAACVCRVWCRLASDWALIAEAFKAPFKLLHVHGRPLLHTFWRRSALSCFAISHTVQRDDTVARLAIRFKVQVAEIRRLNNMMSDHGIHSRDRLLIPVASPELLQGQSCHIERDFHSRRELAVLYLNGDAPAGDTPRMARQRLKRAVFDSMKSSMKLDDETARSYLALAGGDFRQAMLQLKLDLDWEQETTSRRM